ncbi:MBL fold metallo-hydrolase [Planctomycetales bacterium 10988]|nr:MBL fold metallo-hydrolase [Planctomycetales bacterium 10988]
MIGCQCATCQSTDPRDHRTRCAVVCGLPEGNLLIDTPPDLRTQLLREDIRLIHAVAFTHGHADHLHGLDDVRLFPHYTGENLPIYCETEVEDRIRKTFDYAFDPVMQKIPAGGVPKVDLLSIDLKPFQALGATILPIRLKHGRWDTMGFRIGDLAYCTDASAIPEPSFERLKNLEVLILDCLRPNPHPTHFHLEEALEVVERIGAKQTYFTHLSCRMPHAEISKHLPAGVALAYDGLKIPLPVGISQ